MRQRLLEHLKGEKSALWVLATCVFLLAMNAIIAGVIYSDIYDDVYHSHAASEHEAARKHEFESRCSQITSVEELRRCFENHIEAGWKTQRAQEDLQAQKEMADWTFWMLIVTGAIGASSILLTGAGIWLVYLNLREARTVSKQATDATKAAQDTVDITRQTAEAQLRAYVNIERIQLTQSGRTGEYTVTASIKNYGHTPAYDYFTRMWIHYDVTYDKSNFMPTRHLAGSNVAPIPPNGEANYGVVLLKGDDWERFMKKKDVLFVYGRVEYRDAFGRRRGTWFRQYLTDLLEREFTRCPYGNKST